MSSIVNIILELLRASRGYLRDMSKAPLEKIEQTLDIGTLIWMLLYGTFPYPTPEKQLEELIGSELSDIEGRTEEAKQGYVWVYRISYLWRVLTLDVVWIDDILTTKIANRITYPLPEPVRVIDVLTYLTPNLKVIKLLETIKVMDALRTYKGSPTDEYLSLNDEVVYTILQALQKIYDESITITDELITWSGSGLIKSFDEPISLTEELLSQSASRIAYTFDESIRISEGETEGYPYPEEPTKTLWKYTLGESVFILDGYTAEVIQAYFSYTLYPGYSNFSHIATYYARKYNDYTRQGLYTYYARKYDGLNKTTITIT